MLRLVLELALLAAPLGGTDASPLEGFTLTGLSANPSAVRIERSIDQVQLLLTASTESGAALDVTREALLVAETALVAVDERGLITPLADGEGALRFRVGEHEVEVPVIVQGLAAEFEPSFRQDVMPVLTRQGCNAGTCHGAQDGQNGFVLSLRGYDAKTDHEALTDELSARRFDRVDPERSLFLRKPAGEVPHGGGQLLSHGSRDYELLRSWVARGAPLGGGEPEVVSIEILPEEPVLPRPGLEQQMRVLASYDDGTRRDVTAQAFVETSDTEVTSLDEAGLVRGLRRGEASVYARYQGRYAATRLFVMEERAGFAWPSPETYNWIDELVYEKLERLEVAPSALVSDAGFLRRARLDLTGRLPELEEVRTFLLDARDSRTKREELVDRLIGSPEYVEHWTNRWCDLLQVNAAGLGREGATAMRRWVRAQVASNRPYDAMVRDLIVAEGSSLENPPASWHRLIREPDLQMEATTQLFLGVRFNCNKCHDHPFERWTQDQHWELAAYYARVGREGMNGAERIFDRPDGELSFPDGARTAQPSFPFELVSAQVEAQESASASGAQPLTRRQLLASWLTAPDNPYFARSYVNRLWSYMMGVGLIEPVDDLRASNPPSNPALLDRLTEEFVDSGFDVRATLRRICTSRAYSHAIDANEWNAHDELNYSRFYAKRLPAEVLYDAVHQAAGLPARIPGTRVGTRASQLVDPRLDSNDNFLGLFGRPPRESVCECERADGVSLGQALNLVNGPTVADALAHPQGAISHLVATESRNEAVVEELYLRFLGREPSAAESADLAAAIDPSALENALALDPDAQAQLAQAYAAWEASQAPNAEWSVVQLGPESRASGGSELEFQEEGVLRITGPSPETQSLTLIGTTDLGTITGLRLEVFADDALPAKGPGRAQNGNFVLQDLEVTAIPLADPAGARELPLAVASADFSQGNWDVGGVIDDDPRSGWAVSPQFGRTHSAVFELAEDFHCEGPALLVARLEQNFGTKHVIGRLRISATDSQRPVRQSSLPAELSEALRVEPDQRTEQQRALLHRHFMETQPELRRAVRLGAAQDIAWALANSAGFLFNH